MNALKSKVRNATYTGRTWSLGENLYYVHRIEFEDNNIGEYSSVNEDQRNFIIGEEREYTIEPNTNPNYPPKIKPKFAGAMPTQYAPTGYSKSSAGFSDEKEAMISTIAVLKSSLESQQVKPADIKSFVADFYPFFLRFIKNSPKVDVQEMHITETEMGMPPAVGQVPVQPQQPPATPNNSMPF